MSTFDADVFDTTEESLTNQMIDQLRITEDPILVLCPLCARVMKDPWVLPCFHSICDLCIFYHSYESNHVCPICPDPLNECMVATSQSVVSGLSPIPEEEVYERTNNLSVDSTSEISTHIHYPASASDYSSPILRPVDYRDADQDIKSTTGTISEVTNQFDNKQIMAVNGEGQNDQIVSTSFNTFNESFELPPMYHIETIESRAPSKTPHILRGEMRCCFHSIDLIAFYCMTCRYSFCFECVYLHEVHSYVMLENASFTLINFLNNYVSKIKNDVDDLEVAYLKTLLLIKHLDENISIAKENICNPPINKISPSLEERKQTLLLLFNYIHQQKRSSLLSQADIFKSAKSFLMLVKDGLDINLSSYSIIKLMNLHDKACEDLHNIKSLEYSLTHFENETVTFTLDAEYFKQKIWHIGSFPQRGCAYFSFAYGECCKNEFFVQVNVAYFWVQCHNYKGMENTTGGERVEAILDYPSGNSVFLSVRDSKNGKYVVTFHPRELGTYKINVTLNGLHISNSPLNSIVICDRKLPLDGTPVRSAVMDDSKDSLRVFGKADSVEDSLKRSGGIHVDEDEFIYVTDIKKHCVLIFGPDLKFHIKFGRHGIRIGEMHRPTGITVDSLKRIIVADRNNHRVQLFSINGAFIFKFGRFGSAEGEFDSPWDVDTNSKGLIAVSDSKNRRIQLFDQYGNLVRSMNSLRIAWNTLLMPRGVCFDHKGNILATDYGNNHIFVINESFDLRTIRVIGAIGSVKFHNPQGLHIDKNGNILVADSNKGGIKIISPEGKLLYELCSDNKVKNKNIVPCGIASSHYGSIFYAVDTNSGWIYQAKHYLSNEKITP